MDILKGTRVTWLGHSVVLVETAAGTRILIDPFITGNPKYPKSFKLPAKIDYILLTHGHGDHVGDTVQIANQSGATVVAIYELADFVAQQGLEKTIGMNLGGTVRLGEVAVTMTEAKHSSGAHGATGTEYVGIAAGYVLEIEGGAVLYHAGDTAVFGDMRLIYELYRPQIAMLPIGGHYTMGPREAAMAVRLLEPNLVLPLHFGTFPPLTGTPSELQELLGSSVKVAFLEPGDSL